MARVLLIDSNERHASTLASALERCRHAVTICKLGELSCEELSTNGNGFDVVVLDLSRNTQEEWKTLDQIRAKAAMKTPAPAILCFSWVNRGPEMRLRAERKGARFMYVR